MRTSFNYFLESRRKISKTPETLRGRSSQERADHIENLGLRDYLMQIKEEAIYELPKLLDMNEEKKIANITELREKVDEYFKENEKELFILLGEHSTDQNGKNIILKEVLLRLKQAI